MPRIVVSTGDPSFAVCKGIVELDRRIADVESMIVRHAPARTVRRLVRIQWRNVRNGWRWLLYQGKAVVSLVEKFGHPLSIDAVR